MASIVVVVALVSLGSLAHAGENWPQFRGPEGNGCSDAKGLPLRWSEKENVKWKTAIHGRGWSSPVIWDNQIWLTTATDDGHDQYAVCVDRDSGKIVHDIQLFHNDKLQITNALNSYASPTPVIEAGRVYVHFGVYGTACLDTQSVSHRALRFFCARRTPRLVVREREGRSTSIQPPPRSFRRRFALAIGYLTIAQVFFFGERPFQTGGKSHFLTVFMAGLLFFSVVGLVVDQSGSRLLAPLRMRWLRFLGRISYGLYLFHMFALVFVGEFVARAFHLRNLLLMRLAAFAATLALATASWRWFERPILQIRDRWFPYDSDQALCVAEIAERTPDHSRLDPKSVQSKQVSGE